MANHRSSHHALVAATVAVGTVMAGATPVVRAGSSTVPTDPVATTASAPPLQVSGRNWIELSPVLVAAESFATQPVVVNGGGVDDIASGDADVATNAETQLLQESVTNPDLRIIMTVAESFYRLVARGSAGIETLADLEGKRVMVPPDTSANYFVVAMLATVGLTEDDVEIVGMPEGTAYLSGMDQMSTALARGDVDAIAIFEPEPADAIDALGDDAVVFQDPDVYREAFNLHASATALADPEQRAAIVEFVRAVIAASDALSTDPEQYWPFISNTTGFTVAEIEASWPEMEFPAQIVPDMLDVLEVEELWVAANEDREPRPRAELAELIDPSVVEEALAG